ncbi:MAG TPA: hypothetical protein DEW22_02140 [Clostridiales bacterium]|nr:hypothetical protein [Clostridiales bacterium]
MTWKKFWKRVNALLHDNRTVLRDGEDIEDWEEVQRKQREEEAERRRKEDEILSNWFVRDEYINAGWLKRILLTIQFLFRDTHGKTGYQDPEAFARFYEAQKENYVGLESEHKICGKVYHVTNYLDRSKEATAFDKIDELIDRNR